MYDLHLTWKRCRDGVAYAPTSKAMVFEPTPPGEFGPGLLGLGRHVEKELEEPEFRDRSTDVVEDHWQISRPDDFIVLRFVNAKTAQQMQTFLGRYGFLKRQSPDGRSLERWIRAEQSYLKTVLTVAGAEAPKATVPVLNQALVQHQVVPAPPAPFFMPSESPDFELAPLKLEPILHNDPAAKLPTLGFRSPTLYDHMVMECVTIAVRGIAALTCQNCGNLYLSGPTTGRKAKGRFCSDRCRVADMRKRNANQPTV